MNTPSTTAPAATSRTTAGDVTLSPPPYSVFSPRKKWFIAGLATCAGLFSPLAANIYFPAIPSLARAFNRSTQDINLTVTVYMVFQGISPTLWGAVADSHGRRPVYIASLTIFFFACVGLALTPTSDYWLLMLLRCLSASGSAVVIALGAGTVGDISQPFERGKYMGVVTIGPMLGPCIGPVFGGLLNAGLGWRAIFWFLAILSFSVLIAHIMFFPETLRSVVGNGSIPPHGLSTPLWDFLMRLRSERKNAGTSDDQAAQTRAPRKEINPFVALKYFLEKDVAIILFFNALNYTTFYAVTTTLSTLFEDNYGLGTSQTGLCYLPIGVGMCVSTFATGRLLDRDFQTVKARVTKQRMLDDRVGENDNEAGHEKLKEDLPEPKIPVRDHNDLFDFPIERARLRSMPIYLFVFWSSVISYGWLVQYKVNLAVPLVFQFIIGYSCVSVMQIAQVLLVDLYPGKGASITANNNLCRCLIGAVGTAVIDPIMKAIKPGWTMVLFVGICVLASPLEMLEWRQGMVWRQRRADREKASKLGVIGPR